MNQHKASNGVTVYLDSEGDMKFLWGETAIMHQGLESFWVQAAREYFQAEQDEQLGRWRDPEIPEWVCYSRRTSPDVVYVLNEYEGLSYRRERGQAVYPDGESSEVAGRYFAAHRR